MSLEETLEQTQISFKNPLTIEEIKLLFKSLASHFKCTISYTLESLGRIDGSYGKFESEEYISKVGGKITRKNIEKKELAMVQFEFEEEYINDEKESYFTKFKFNLMGHDFDELSPAESKLIREIRQYLSERINQ